MEFLLILPLISLIMALIVTGIVVVRPYATGTKQIDQTKYPILARAQRIHRYKNVKAREIEFTKKNTEISNRVRAIETNTTNAIHEKAREGRDTHDQSIREWERFFDAITYEEDQRKLAEAKALEEQKRAEQLAIWQAQEKVRMDRFIADQKALAAEENRKTLELMQGRENDLQALRKYYVPDHQNKSFGYRIVDVHGLYVRTLPIKASRIVDNLTPGAMLSVNGWITGEELYGNPIWFKLANNAGWVWSGGVDNKSTSGLMNYNYMNEPGDTFVSKSADGAIHQTFETPSEMKALIDAEIVAIEQEKRSLESKISGSTNPYGSINATMLTAGSINANIISITRGGMTVTKNELEVLKKPKKDWYTDSVQKKGGLTAPQHTQYNIFSDGEQTTNFWRGTEFEHLGE